MLILKNFSDGNGNTWAEPWRPTEEDAKNIINFSFDEQCVILGRYPDSAHILNDAGLLSVENAKYIPVDWFRMNEIENISEDIVRLICKSSLYAAVYFRHIPIDVIQTLPLFVIRDYVNTGIGRLELNAETIRKIVEFDPSLIFNDKFSTEIKKHFDFQEMVLFATESIMNETASIKYYEAESVYLEMFYFKLTDENLKVALKLKFGDIV